MRNEKELIQRITMTSNMSKPGDKVAPKAFEMKLDDPNAPKPDPAPAKIVIPPPRKRVRKGRRKPLLLNKRNSPNSEDDTRASSNAQKVRNGREYLPRKQLKVRKG
jgi:hypothetical protein